MKIHGRFYIVSWIFFSSNLYSIICNFTFHQNLCIWQFVFNKAQWIEFMDGLNIRNFCRKNIKSLKEDCSIQFFSLYLCCKENVRDGICHSRHSRRECKIFDSGVNFSRNNAVCYINESKTLHFTPISSQKLLTYY